jgi:TonB family protein
MASGSVHIVLVLAGLLLPLLITTSLPFEYQVTPIAAVQTEVPRKPLLLRLPNARVKNAVGLGAPVARLSKPRELPAVLLQRPTKVDTPAKLSLAKVQTGGFGDDAFGLPPQRKAQGRVQINQFGSAELPQGPGVGNGTGGAAGMRAAVRDAGFATAVPESGAAGARPGVGGEAGTQSVVVLDKPLPVYTEDGRRHHVEGDVTLAVIFPASGPIHVLRVLKGLGYGLDEAAIRAAQQIQFRPALQNGRPVATPATLRIVFQLAS